VARFGWRDAPADTRLAARRSPTRHRDWRAAIAERRATPVTSMAVHRTAVSASFSRIRLLAPAPSPPFR